MTNLNSTTITVDLADYASGNPFEIGGGVNIHIEDGTAIYGNDSALWTISNVGTVAAYGQGSIGVDLKTGGDITNESTNSLIYGSHYGVLISGAAGTIKNSGRIEAFEYMGVGIRLQMGGTVVNYGSDALINGDNFGVFSRGAADITNQGTIIGFADYGIFLDNGGTVINQGSSSMISGGGDGLGAAGSGATLINAGTVEGGFGYYHYDTSVGMYLLHGGSVNNLKGGLIRGRSFGIEVSGAPVYIRNQGTIYDTDNYAGIDSGAIRSPDGGNVLNTKGASIVGEMYGIYLGESDGSPDHVYNAGKIEAQIILPPKTENYFGVELFSGSVTNVSGGIIEGGAFGIRVDDIFSATTPSGTVINAGTIESGDAGVTLLTRTGILLDGGGFVENSRSGEISGQDYALKMVSYHYNATVINAGRIIAGGTAGIAIEIDRYISGTGTLMNDVLVQNSGLVEATGRNGCCVRLEGVLINSGTIAAVDGGEAVVFGDGNNILVLDPGAKFIGAVEGGQGTNTIQLAHGSRLGTLAGLGSPAFENFQNLDVETDAAWVLTGSGKLDSGLLITVDRDARLVLTATHTLSGDVTGQGTLSFAGGLTVVNPGARIDVSRLSVSGGDMTEDENWTFSGSFAESERSTITIAEGKTFALSGISLVEGTISGNGTLEFAKTASAIGKGADLLMASWSLENGASVWLGENLTYDGAFSDVAGSSLLVRAGRTLVLGGDVSGSGSIKIGGHAVLDLGKMVKNAEAIDFAGDQGTLRLRDPAGFHARILGFRGGDKIDILSPEFSYDSSETLTFAENAAKTQGVLTIINGHYALSILLFGQYAAAGFHLEGDSQGGTSVTYAPSAAVPARILTGKG